MCLDWFAQIAKFSYDIVDGTYHDRAMAVRAQGGHAIVGGRNYGQGAIEMPD